MKVLGMFFIIWGHLSPAVLNDFIYAFSVPSFFVISGYLYKPVVWKTFLTKNIRSLIVPYLLLCGSLIIFFAIVKGYFGGLTLQYFPNSILAILIGNQDGISPGIGCQALWFVYTLFIVRCIANVVSARWFTQLLISIAMLSIAYQLNSVGCELFSSVANVTLAYPFFIMGFWFKMHYGLRIAQIVGKSAVSHLSLKKLSIVVFCFGLVYLISVHNGMVKMYNAQYGNDLILFLIAGFIGTILLAYISMQFGTYEINGLVRLLSNGSILVLAWQIVFTFAITIMLPHIINADLQHNDLLTFCMACMIYVAFIPIVKTTDRYMPILCGYR